MRKVLKALIIAAISLVTVLGMVACDNSAANGGNKKGISGSVIDGGIYEIRKYYAETGVEVLDLGTIELPEGITKIKIKSHAFEGNSTLKSIKVPSNTVEIGSGAFAEMTKLETLELPYVGRYFNADYKQNSSDFDKKAVNAERTIAHLFGSEEYNNGSKVVVNYGSGTSTVYVPATLNKIIVNNATEEEYSIPMYAFNGVTKFSSIELKGKIVGIGEYAFSGVGGIETINIPATVKTIYKGAFTASYIKNFVLDNACSDVKVLESAFSGCTLFNFFGSGTVKNLTIDLAKLSKSDLGNNAFNLTDNEIEYTVQNKDGVDMSKVFGI